MATVKKKIAVKPRKKTSAIKATVSPVVDKAHKALDSLHKSLAAERQKLEAARKRVAAARATAAKSVKAADKRVDTIVQPSLEELAISGGVLARRIVISDSLNWEMKSE